MVKKEGKKSKIEKRYPFDKALAGFLLVTVVPVLKAIHGVKIKEREKLPDGPCVVLFNHVTDLDILWVIDYFYEYMYVVASEHVLRFPVGGKLITLFFAPIYIKKGAGGAGAVMEMSRHLRCGHKVTMAPEGVRSGNGLTGPLIPSTAAVLRKLKCPVVTVRIHGGYFTTPRWGKGVRKGRITVEKVHEYSKEDIAAMTPEEFSGRITEDLSEDAYAYSAGQKEKIAYKGRRLAQGIETQLYLCPQCRNFFTIRSKGNEFFCNCGMHGTIDEYGILNGERVPYSTVTEWDLWQSEYMDKMPYDITLNSSNMTLYEITKEHKKIAVSSGEMVLDANELKLGEHAFPLLEIDEVTIVAYGILQLYTKEKRFFEIRGKKRYPGIAYLKYIQKLKELQK